MANFAINCTSMTHIHFTTLAGTNISKCHSCRKKFEDFPPSNGIVARVKTVTQYYHPHTNALTLSKTRQPVHCHITHECLRKKSKDFHAKKIHICNYLEQMLLPEDVRTIKKLGEID